MIFQEFFQGPNIDFLNFTKDLHVIFERQINVISLEYSSRINNCDFFKYFVKYILQELPERVFHGRKIPKK